MSKKTRTFLFFFSQPGKVKRSFLETKNHQKNLALIRTKKSPTLQCLPPKADRTIIIQLCTVHPEVEKIVAKQDVGHISCSLMP